MPHADRDLKSIEQARRLAERAAGAARGLAALDQEGLDRILDAMHRAALPRAEEWARLAVEETGFGNVPDKTSKNLFSTVDLHRHIRPMRTVGVLREDPSDRVVEIAAPVGVVAAIIPSTNPTSTAIYKIFIALKAGNAVVLSPHPHAQRCIAAVADVLSEAAREAGAPPGSIACMTEPALEGTGELMRHPAVGVILATGGTGLVKAAYSSGKPAFGVGPGNVPAFVDRTADVAKAAADIVAGKCFDNGVLCSSENAVVADRPIAEGLVAEMERRGARFLDEEQTARLSRLAVRTDGSLNTAIVGKSATTIAAMAGLDVPETTRCLVARLAGVGREHPLSREKLSPILAFYVEDGWEACCARVLEVLRYGGMGHTMAIHSQDRDLILRFATTKPVFRICVNTPASVGAVGLTTGLEPSMTLGCGALGGNITSDNIMPRHLINTKRLAFETSSFDRAAARLRAPTGGTPPDPGHASARTPLGRSEPVPGRTSARTPIGGTEPDPGRANAQAPAGGSPPDPGKTGARAPTGGSGPDPGGLTPRAPVEAAIASSSRAGLRERIERALGSRPPRTAPTPAPPPDAPAATPRAAAAAPRAVPFVSEADVRLALLAKRCIPVDERTIITPSARDLGTEHGVFLQV